MLYYYSLLRYHIANQLHIRNRRNLDKRTDELLKAQRRLRIMTDRMKYLEKIKKQQYLS
jgi:hypothetical protein